MKHNSRQKKNLIILLMISAMALISTACGNDAPVSGQVTATEGETNAPETGKVTETETPAESVEQEEAALEDTPLSLGRIQGGIYTNDYAGFACELDSSWEFYTADELQELPGEVTELFEGTELEEALAETDRIMDMKAECVDEMTSMNIAYQKMSMQERLAYSAMDTEEIIDLALTQADMMKEMYAQAGIEVQEMSKKTIQFLGEECPALWTSSITEGINYYTLQIFDYHVGEYAVTTTLASYVEDQTEELAGLFYKHN